MNITYEINIRKASRYDVVCIVRMLADDSLGVGREKYENPIPREYYTAFGEFK